MDKQIKRLNKLLHHLSNSDSEEWGRLQARCKQLRRDRAQSQLYIRILKEDIPSGANVRPMYEVPGQVMEILPEQYDLLVRKLGGNDSETMAAAILALSADDCHDHRCIDPDGFRAG